LSVTAPDWYHAGDGHHSKPGPSALTPEAWGLIPGAWGLKPGA
jgi:hypothetical protein